MTPVLNNPLTLSFPLSPTLRDPFGSGILSIPAGSTIVEIGTSLTDNGYRDHTEGATILGYGSRGVMNYVRLATNQAFDYYNVGVGGDTIEDMLNRFDHDVTPLEPDYIFIDAGTNDSTKTFTEYQTALTTLYNKAKSVAKKDIVIYQIPYRGPTYSSATNDLYEQVNTWIVETQDNVIDTNKYFSNLVTKRPLAGYTVDDLHYSNVGAYNVSRSVLETVKFSERDYVGTGLTLNPSLSGSGGTQDVGVTGTMPDGYHFDVLTGTSTVAVDTDQGHLRAVFTPSGNPGEETFRIRGDAFSTMTANNLYEFISRVKLSDWEGFNYVHLRMIRNGNAVVPSAYDMRQESSLDDWASEAFADFQLMRTEELYTTGDTTNFTPYIEIGIEGSTTGTGTMEVDLWQIQEFTPPVFNDVAMTVPDIEVGFRANVAEIEYNTGTEIVNLYGKYGVPFTFTSASFYTDYDTTAFDNLGGVSVDRQAERLMANANIPANCLVYGVFDLQAPNGVNYDTFGFGTTSTNDFESAVNKYLQSVGQNRWYASEGGSGSQIIGPSGNDYRSTRVAIIAEFKNGVLNYWLNDGATPLEENVDVFDGYINRGRLIMGGGNQKIAELWLSHRTFDDMHITSADIMNDLKTRWSIL